ncbi:hypothetical protein [Ferrimicrobium acidiphilum]|uniref:hypothetical protein n=1 Tax=Ferrimicrobium acidiphilum TaxID=121039 RepID=UPI0023F41A37|nr:hypothetical protein [Ferrimicrobium acidiphilum]
MAGSNATSFAEKSGQPLLTPFTAQPAESGGGRYHHSNPVFLEFLRIIAPSNL